MKTIVPRYANVRDIYLGTQKGTDRRMGRCGYMYITVVFWMTQLCLNISLLNLTCSSLYTLATAACFFYI